MLERTEPEIEIRCRFQGHLARELKELQKIGNFTTLKATVEYVVGVVTPSMVSGLLRMREEIETSQAHSILTVRDGREWLSNRPSFRDRNLKVTRETLFKSSDNQLAQQHCQECGAVLEGCLHSDLTQHCPQCGCVLPTVSSM